MAENLLLLYIAAGAALSVGAILALVKPPAPGAPSAAVAETAAAAGDPAAEPAAVAASPFAPTSGALAAPRQRSAASKAIAAIAERADTAAAAASGTAAAADEVEAIDLDAWRGRRQAVRASCDACVVLALLAAMAWVLVHDYGVDVPEAVRRAFPREAALVESLAGGARSAVAAPARWWRELQRGEEL